ncbi:MAG: glycolate oxidase subunit GlcE [Polaromonas sp.]|nr:glycolate oxidase subunit GlcE [Polaromonas sp.]
MDKHLDVLNDWTERVRAAAASGSPLRIRGSGSKDFYGQVLTGAVLDTSAYSGIVSYEPSELVVTARAGTPLAELEALLAAQGQCLPFEPPHFGPGATVGGMVASGLNGPARSSAGAVRDYVLGTQLLNGKAEVLTFGGQVMKNVAGYDVSRLMAGSLGTLAVLLEVSLKVLPVAPAESTLHFALDETAALQQLNRWGGLPLPINAACWQSLDGEGQLSVRLRGAVAAVAAAQKTMGGTLLTSMEATPLWHGLREQTAAFFALQPGESLWRASVTDTAAPLNLGPTLIEWGGAQRWLKRPATDVARIRATTAGASGHATLFRAGSPQDKATAVFTPLAEPLERIHRSLKQQFDPAGVFNPQRLSTSW